MRSIREMDMSCFHEDCEKDVWMNEFQIEACHRHTIDQVKYRIKSDAVDIVDMQKAIEVMKAWLEKQKK